MLARVDLAPADLGALYAGIGDVTWADVGNGYFIDPACDVLLRLKEYGAVDLGANQKARGLVIGSNGGGLCYVTGRGVAVHRTRTATLDEPELDRVADYLRQFLELLEKSLMRFIANGEPEYL
ncbi:SMI1/KNR4 family protein [Streptomyces sp. NPDC052107]|uniref:SMI1/KNR4 family protein n=1 Tax=Streptomyces sp. NPDC052107 TaxID=3155632 RepID=UPI0034388BF2